MRTLILLCLVYFAVPSIVNSQEAGTSLQNELRLLPNDSFAIAIARPSRMFNVKGMANLPMADVVSLIGVKPSEIEHAVAALLPAGDQISFLVKIQATKPFDQDTVLRVLSPRAIKVEDFDYPVFDGEDSQGMTLAFPKPNQLLFAKHAGQIFDALEKNDFSHEEHESELAEMLKSGSKDHIQIVADVEKLRHFSTFSSDDYRHVQIPNLIDGELLQENTDTLQARVDINSKSPIRIKILASKDIAKFQSAVETQLEDFKTQLQGLGDDSETDLVENVSWDNVDKGVLIEYQNSGTPLEFWKTILQSINLGRTIVARQSDMTQTRLNLQQVMLGALTYESVYNKLPANFLDKNGTPLLSWRVALLPFLEEGELYQSFKLDEPWDSEHNKPLIQRMPRYFRDPLNKSPRQQETRIQCLSGKDQGKFSNALTLADVKDGTDNSIALATANTTVPWTKPADLIVDLDEPWSKLSESPIACLFSGAAISLSKPSQEKQLLAGLTIAGGDGGLEYKPSYRSSEEWAEAGKTHMLKKFASKGLSEKVAEYAAQSSFSKKTQAPAEAMEIAIKFIESKDPDQIGVGLLILSRLEPTYDWRKLQPVLDSDFITNRRNAISLIVKTRDPKAIASVFISHSELYCVWESLGDHEIDAEAISGLVPILKHKDPELRIDAGWALTIYGEQTYRSNIEKLQQDKDENVRKEAVEMIEELETPTE